MSRIGVPRPLPIDARPRFSIDQLLWIANTRHGPGGHWFARVQEDVGDHDHLLEPADASDYLERHHVPVPAGPPGRPVLDRLRVIREMIRGLIDPTAPDWTPEARRLLARSRFVIDPGGEIRSAAEGWDGFVSDLLLPLLQLVPLRTGLGICGNPHCRLIFLDLSRNGTRRWCDTRGCGNRDRVGRYRHPARDGESQTLARPIRRSRPSRRSGLSERDWPR